MTDLSRISPEALRRAAALPANAHARSLLLRAAGGHGEGVGMPEVREVAQEGKERAAEARSGVDAAVRPGVYCCCITPIGKPRQTQSDKWNQRPAVVRYRQYADELRAWAERVCFRLPESRCTIRFEIPMPASWSEAEKAAMNGEPHQQRPDVDNLVKAVFDALLAEDCRVWHVSIEKRWARDGAVVFVVA